jgi:RHS repeat-associated protein
MTNRAAAPGMAGNCYTEGLSATATVQNQLSGIGVTYDAAGNVTNDGAGNTPTYDAENRIATDAGVTYSYDADGRRMEKSSGTKYWFGPGGAALTETSLSGTINEEYVFFNGERIARVDRPSGTVHFYFSNPLGSASVITNYSGTIEQQTDYYPFGGVAYTTGSDTNHYKFTGKEWDSESNLDNFGARYFASTMGRFMSPDWAARPTAVPYALFGDPQSLNLYTYVRNDPVTLADADGHQSGEAACPPANTTSCNPFKAEYDQDNSKKQTPPSQTAQNNTTVVHNADGTTTSTTHSSSTSSSADSNGNITETATSTTTVQTLNAHGDIQQTTSYSSTYSATVDSSGRVTTSTTNTAASVDANSPLAQGMQAAARTPSQHDATDWLNDVPVAGKFLKRAVDALGGAFTYQDVGDTMKAVGEKVRQNPALYCPSPTGCGAP